MRPRQKTQFVEIVGKVGDILKQERHFEGRRHFEAGKTTGKVWVRFISNALLVKVAIRAFFEPKNVTR